MPSLFLLFFTLIVVVVLMAVGPVQLYVSMLYFYQLSLLERTSKKKSMNERMNERKKPCASISFRCFPVVCQAAEGVSAHQELMSS